MLKKFVRHQVNFISTNSNISDVYELDRIRYGLEVFYSETFKIMILLIIALFINKLSAFLVMFSLLMLIRPHMGGSHANSFIGCLIQSNLLFLIIYYTGDLIPKINVFLQLLVFLITFISVNRFKPVNRFRKNLNNSYGKVKFKNIIISTVILWFITSNLFLSNYLINCGTLMIIYILVDYLKEVYIHEKNKQI